jgi:large subunit ribosomal protein L21e
MEPFKRGEDALTIISTTYRRSGLAIKLTSFSMPHKVYHGKTGVIYNVTKSAVGVIIYKRVGNRYIEKRVNVRVEHINLSRSREEFINRVKENALKKQKAKAEGTHVLLKRQPAMPRESRTVDAKDNPPETVTPIPYETTI